MQRLEPSFVTALRARDVELASPLNQVVLIRSALPASIVKHLSDVYIFFNGFLTADYKSQLRLWSIEEIRDNAQNQKLANTESYLYIGDFLIESDYIRMSVEGGSVDFEGDPEKKFTSISALLESIVDGSFDFL